jgi:hypothetical protein
MTNPPLKSSPSRPRLAAPPALLLLALAAAGCTGVPAYQQRYLVRPEMQFSDDPAYALAAGILYQTETGAAVSGGAASAGCTSCR